MAALRTEQLECLLDCVLPNTVRTLGVFPANCIPLHRDPSSGILSTSSSTECNQEFQPHSNIGNHYCFILNTHPKDEPGEHWLAFLFNTNTNRLEYFDSFGFPLSMYTHVYEAMSSCNVLSSCVRVNTLGMLQSTSSTVCGHYCIAELYWRAKHMDASVDRFAHILISTNATPLERDKFVVERLRTITSKHPCCATQLFGKRAVTDTATRVSQSCCCRDSCTLRSCI